ncbi:MAG: hypothetical protein ABI131_02575 [Nostocoides sp.]
MSIDVSGGTGGMSAELDELEGAARILDALSAQLVRCAGHALAAATSPAVAAAPVCVALACPALGFEAAIASSELERQALAVGGPSGAFGEAAALELLACTVRAVVAAYRGADRAVSALIAEADDVVMAGVGLAAPVLFAGVGGLLLAAATTPVGPGARPAQLAGLVDEAAYRMPWLVDIAAGGVDGLLRGLATDPLCAVVLVAAAARAGVGWPPRDEATATAILEQVGGMVGALLENDAYAAVAVAALPPGPLTAQHAPTGVAGLMTDAVELGDPAMRGRVRISQIPQPDGSSAWIVQLPGTQVWDPRPGPDPFDVSTDVAAMAGLATLAAAGATLALDLAMTAAGRSGVVGRRDPVLLTGHSQGGILSAAVASDPAFRSAHPCLQVVTAGSPIANFPIPPTVPVLSLENLQDPVPRLDGTVNPDRPTWTTVRADLRERGAPASAGASHASRVYLRTAEQVDGAIATHQSVSLDAWAAGAAPFFGGDRPARVTDYVLTRVATGG